VINDAIPNAKNLELLKPKQPYIEFATNLTASYLIFQTSFSTP